MNKTYDIYLVPNGARDAFRDGITRDCQCWGHDMTLDEVRTRYRELADENFRREGGEYDRIWDECAASHPEQADEGFSEPEIACEKYLDELTADPDPLDWQRIEWQNDLKWVTIRETPDERAPYRIAVVRKWSGPRESWEWTCDERGEPVEFATLEEVAKRVQKLRDEPVVLQHNEAASPSYFIIGSADCAWLDNDDGGKYDWSDYEGDDDDEDAKCIFAVRQDCEYILAYAVEEC